MQNVPASQMSTQEIYNFAASLMITQGQTHEQVMTALLQKGLSLDEANKVITLLQNEVDKHKGEMTTQETYNYAASLLITQKQPAQNVVAALQQKGLSHDESLKVVTLLQDEVRKRKRSTAKGYISTGAVISVIGIVITAVSYSSASGGGRYVVAWGAIVFGIILMIRGFIGSVK